MKTINTGVLPALLLGASLVCAGLSGCATNDQAGSPDAMTAQDVRHALVNQGGQEFASVNVRVNDGVAKLSGRVQSADERDRAALIAAGVGNVHQTINNISVGRAIRLDSGTFPNPTTGMVDQSE